MRVLHVIGSFSPLTETFIYDLVRETALHADVLVATQERVDADARPFDRVVLLDRPRGAAGALRDVLVARLSREATPFTGWVSARRALLDLARRARPALVHAHFGDQGVLAAPVARRLGVPMVTSFYGHDASSLPRAPGWRRWYGELVAGRNHVVALSHTMRAELVALGLAERRIHVVATGKRLEEYPFRERTAPPARLVSVGRLVEKKGHADAIEVVARVADPAVSLDIVGGGPLAPSLAARIAAAGVADRVRLHGALDHARARELMDRADALLLCSRTASDGDREGVPTVLMEAQALGLPCVATRHAGIPEAIPTENHWLLSPEGDVAAIAGALGRLRAASPGERAAISRRGLAHVRANHDVARQAERLVACYEVALRA